MDNKKILVVEDEAVSAMELKQNLLELGYDVLAIVKSGEEAVRKAGELAPDLILMDIALAGPMNGIQAAAEIKKRHPIPIIYLSAHTDSETLDQAKVTEPFAYLPKPCSMKTVAATIEMAFYKSAADAARKKAEDELERVRHEHEELLRQSEEKYRTVADFTYDWEFWLGPDDNFLYCSPSCERITGHAAAAFASDASLLRKLVHPDDLIDFDHRQAAKDGTIAQGFDFRIIHADGSIRWISHTYLPVYNDQGKFLGTRGSNRDVTERKRWQDEATKERNLAALGVLAGGIAHNFNNLFQGLLGNISLAMAEVDESSSAFKYLAKAEQVYVEATKLTSQLLAFSNGGSPLRSDILPADHIREEAAALLAGSELAAEFDLPATLWPIHVDQAQFRNVIKNLVQNAMDAMSAKTGGQLKITASNETLEKGPRTHPTLVPGHYVRISIEDHGCGISQEHLPRIFDPYFSTKELGCQQGMGLGLSLCDTIIKRCGGAITVQSQPGEGSTFQIYIPALVATAQKTAVTRDQEVQGPRLLLMDDDLEVVEVTTKYLRLSGYRVDSTLDGEAALAAYQEARAAGDPYALVILDLTIPGGLGGKEVIASLKDIDPEVKAIVFSGYTDDLVITNFAEYGFVAACSKPLLLSEMKEVINSVLAPPF
jgi:PAS domain S-box-containing protein